MDDFGFIPRRAPLDMTIPEIRERLHELANELGVMELHDLAEATRRRHNGRQTAPRQGTPGPHMALAIRDFAKAHPEATEFDIGRHFNVNQGRVSEALYGKR